MIFMEWAIFDWHNKKKLPARTQISHQHRNQVRPCTNIFSHQSNPDKKIKKKFSVSVSWIPIYLSCAQFNRKSNIAENAVNSLISLWWDSWMWIIINRFWKSPFTLCFRLLLLPPHFSSTINISNNSTQRYHNLSKEWKWNETKTTMMMMCWELNFDFRGFVRQIMNFRYELC